MVGRSKYIVILRAYVSGGHYLEAAWLTESLLVICKRGRRHKTGAKCAVHKDENCFLCDPTWAQGRLCAEKYVTVTSTVSGCDVTYCATTSVQQARLLASRGCVTFARRPSFATEKNFKNLRMLTCVDRSTRPNPSYPEISTVIRLAQLSTHAKH